MADYQNDADDSQGAWLAFGGFPAVKVLDMNGSASMATRDITGFGSPPLTREIVPGEADPVERHLERERELLTPELHVLQHAPAVAGPGDPFGHLEALLEDRVMAERNAVERVLP